MVRKLKIVLGVAAVVLALGLGLALLLPSSVRVERSIVVPRPLCTTYALLDGFGRFNEWSPWAPLDPDAVYTFDGPAHGVGATMRWTSKSPKVGDGAQTIVAATPCSSVNVKLTFHGRGDSHVGYLLSPGDAGGTAVTWWMEAPLGMNPLARYFGLMVDSLVGEEFEAGLAGLVRVANTLPADDFAGLTFEPIDVPPSIVARTSAPSAKDPMAVGAAIDAGVAEIDAAIAGIGLRAAGPPRVSYADEGAGWQIDVAVPVEGAPTGQLPTGAVALGPGYAGPALRTTAASGGSIADRFAKVAAYLVVMGVPRRTDAAPYEERASDGGAIVVPIVPIAAPERHP